ncbi:putative beta-glucosidase G [Emericellopsis cladophorae]|uniref:Beta-glucosidase cel3A n=1 Tax=Emericellopsis cladophorae TaxID=2686198 RepID=A0A9Q0BAW9_9HYPO|nr:putative beta-glucosidase G [Emericellopsis cladophorae]KAI6779252.1 putative beta-glucosidase G [Emericellopsis cladophorae]
MHLKLHFLSALVASIVAQHYAVPNRPEGAFSYIQPANTTILGQYGHSPAVYPSPRISGAGRWEESLRKARKFVAELTLEEKATMVTGKPGPCTGNIYPIHRMGFSGLCLQDGPAAIRNADYSSVFPAGVTIASSWDRKMMYDRSVAMGREFKSKGAHIALAPAVGPLGRSAYSGRNWEGFSPDPYLSGVAMGLSVRGLQDAGVQATAKHFILNEQEILRNPTLGRTNDWVFEAVSSNADDRTMHELYLWPFANAVHEQVSAVMCSYQRINGSYGCQNSKALNGLLKEELGFQGYVMSDWFATHAGVASMEAGLDMDMPGTPLRKVILPDGSGYNSYLGGNVTLAVRNGTISKERVNDMVERIMTPYFFLKQNQNFPTIDPSSMKLKALAPSEQLFYDWEAEVTAPASRDVRDDHGQLIRKHAAASTILLKNEKNALPLRSPKSIYVYGNDAGDTTQGPLNQEEYEFGNYAVGGGSGAARFSEHVTPLRAIQERAAAQGNALVQFWLNNTQILEMDPSSMFSTEEPDVCIVMTKSWASEGWDRETLDLEWEGSAVVDKVASVCSNTMVVIHSGGINMMPFASHPNVTAIIAAHYPGDQAGYSMVDVMYGDVNPSGRLPYTIAHNPTDYEFAPITTGVTTNGTEDWQSWFDEKLFIDYRHFDKTNTSVLYEFGFGLSYTTFALSNLTIHKVATGDIEALPKKQDIAPGGNPALWETLYKIEIMVHNTGHVRGAAVPQLYITFPEQGPDDTPVRQLRGFEKIELSTCGQQTVNFELMRRDISYWDVAVQQWRIPEGEITISAGWSSRDLVEFGTFTVA